MAKKYWVTATVVVQFPITAMNQMDAMDLANTVLHQDMGYNPDDVDKVDIEEIRLGEDNG